MHSSWGGGLRTGNADATAALRELGKSVEGLHAVLRFGSETSNASSIISSALIIFILSIVTAPGLGCPTPRTTRKPI